MNQCKNCKHFIMVGISEMVCMSHETQTAKLTGVAAARCDVERITSPMNTTCGYHAQFFDPRTEVDE